MRFDIGDYLSSRVRVHRRAESGEIVCQCFKCGRPNKFWVNENTGQWICYRCAEGGSLTNLVQLLDGVSRAAAHEFLVEAGAVASRSAAELLAERPAPDEEPDVAPKIDLPPEFVSCFDSRTRMRTWPTYLTERHVSVRTAITYGLGFCPRGKYGNRLVIPVRSHGELRTFAARALVKGLEPKYLHPSNDHKSGCLFGLDEAIGATEVVLVEGPFDVFGCVRAGLVAVGLLGKRMTDEQHGLLIRSGFRRAVMMLDPDAAAENREIEGRLTTTMEGVRRATLPTQYDPGDAPPELLRKAKEIAR